MMIKHVVPTQEEPQCVGYSVKYKSLRCFLRQHDEKGPSGRVRKRPLPKQACRSDAGGTS